MRPWANRMPPPNVAGAKAGGVHAPSLRSHVSEWLGPPAMNTKRQFRAVPLRAGDVAASALGNGRRTPARNEPAMPVPAISNKRRLEKDGPKTGKLLPPRVHASQISFFVLMRGLQ